METKRYGVTEQSCDGIKMFEPAQQGVYEMSWSLLEKYHAYIQKKIDCSHGQAVVEKW